MEPALVDQRSPWRSLSCFVLRHVLRREQLTATIPGLDLRVRAYARDVMGRHLYKRGLHEQVLSTFVLRELRLRDDAVALDIGANLGWYSLLLARRWPRARIHAFEPEPRNLALLRSNLQRNGITNVTVPGSAVAERDGAMQFFPYAEKNMGRHSLVPQAGCTPITVPVVTLDGFLQQQRLDPADVQFVKIDVEGYELPALQGARSLLAAKPRILAEFAPKYVRSDGDRGRGYAPRLSRDPAAGRHRERLHGADVRAARVRPRRTWRCVLLVRRGKSGDVPAVLR